LIQAGDRDGFTGVAKDRAALTKASRKNRRGSNGAKRGDRGCLIQAGDRDCLIEVKRGDRSCVEFATQLCLVVTPCVRACPALRDMTLGLLFRVNVLTAVERPRETRFVGLVEGAPVPWLILSAPVPLTWSRPLSSANRPAFDVEAVLAMFSVGITLSPWLRCGYANGHGNRSSGTGQARAARSWTGSAAIPGRWDRGARYYEPRHAWGHATEPPRTPPPERGKGSDARTCAGSGGFLSIDIPAARGRSKGNPDLLCLDGKPKRNDKNHTQRRGPGQLENQWERRFRR
jgi:hypothetical protein